MGSSSPVFQGCVFVGAGDMVSGFVVNKQESPNRKVPSEKVRGETWTRG